MRKTFALVFAVSLILVGCGGGTENAPTEVQAMPDDEVKATANQASGGMMGGLNTEITLDPEIAERWAGIRVQVVDSETGNGATYDVPLGETVALGESGLALTAETFIPDFVMDEQGISSRSAETHNPAARVVITEPGTTDYEGWLFAAMPEIHPFPHDRYQVLLVEGLPAAER